jgi:hypothetical protein
MKSKLPCSFLNTGVLDFSIRCLYLGESVAFGVKLSDKVLGSGTLAFELALESHVIAVAIPII